MGVQLDGFFRTWMSWTPCASATCLPSFSTRCSRRLAHPVTRNVARVFDVTWTKRSMNATQPPAAAARRSRGRGRQRLAIDDPVRLVPRPRQGAPGKHLDVRLDTQVLSYCGHTALGHCPHLTRDP